MKNVWGRLLKLATPFWRQMALAVLLGFATIASSIGLLTTSAYLISKAALQPSIAYLQVAIVGVRFFGISRGLFRYLERLVSHDVTFRLLARLRVWFYDALEPLAPARLAAYRSGDLLTRIVADIDTLQDFYLRVIAPPAVAVLVALLGAVLMGSFDPWLAVVLLFFMAIAGAVTPFLTRSLSRRTGQGMVQVRADLNGLLVDGIQGLADLLAYGQGRRYQDQVQALSAETQHLQRRMASVDGLNHALTGLLMNLAILAVLVIAIPMVSSNQLDGIYLALLVMAVMSCFEAMWPMPQASQQLDKSLEAAQRLFEIVDAEPEVTDPSEVLAVPGRYGLQVEHLRFSYEQGLQPALDDISFELPQGARIAIVGPSGAGKTTLAQLLLRFWDYRDGRILLDGQELRDYGQEDLRRLIAVVSQRSHLFGNTVRENLLLARPEAAEEEMILAAQQAQIHDWIQSLPQGYDTWVGEQGERLSGGERQRLIIARAILKHAPLWILDEPTAHLDAVTERAVLETLHNLTSGHTALLITHRLVGLEAVDEILVLRRGRIVEKGQHAELMQGGGFYHHMWQVQNQILPNASSSLF